MLRKGITCSDDIYGYELGRLIHDIGNKLQVVNFRNQVVFIVSEVNNFFIKDKNKVTLKEGTQVFRTTHNLQVLSLVIDNYFLFTDKTQKAEKGEKALDKKNKVHEDIFDILLLALMHNIPEQNTTDIITKFMDKFGGQIKPEIESKIHSFIFLHKKYRDYVKYYDPVIQNVELDEFERARFFYASNFQQKRMALFKLVDQISVARFLEVKNHENSSSGFYVLMNAAKLFSIDEKAHTERKNALEREFPNIFLQAHYNLAGERYLELESEIEREYGVKYRDLFEIVPNYLKNNSETGLVNILRKLFQKGELEKHGISNKISFFYRVKELDRLAKKIKDGRSIYDLVGIKGVINGDLPKEKLYIMIRNLYDLLEVEFFGRGRIVNIDDYFAEPKKSGYSNVIHYDIPNAIGKVPVELQLVGIQDDIKNQYSRKTNHFVYSEKIKDIELKEVIAYLDLSQSDLKTGRESQNLQNCICDFGEMPDLFKLLYDMLVDNGISVSSLDKNYYFEIFRNGKYSRLSFDDYKKVPNGAMLRLRKANVPPVKGLSRELSKIRLRKLSETSDKLPPRNNNIKISLVYKGGKVFDKNIHKSYLSGDLSFVSFLLKFCEVDKLPQYFSVVAIDENGNKVNINNKETLLNGYSKIELLEVSKKEKHRNSFVFESKEMKKLKNRLEE